MVTRKYQVIVDLTFEDLNDNMQIDLEEIRKSFQYQRRIIESRLWFSDLNKLSSITKKSKVIGIINWESLKEIGEL